MISHFRDNYEVCLLFSLHVKVLFEVNLDIISSTSSEELGSLIMNKIYVCVFVCVHFI